MTLLMTTIGDGWVVQMLAVLSRLAPSRFRVSGAHIPMIPSPPEGAVS